MDEWNPVLEINSSGQVFGYAEGFVRDREYEFMRGGWESPQLFRMCDVDPAFNLWGLKYREIAALGGNTDTA